MSTSEPIPPEDFSDLPDTTFRFKDLRPYEQQFLEALFIHGHPSRAALSIGRKSQYGNWILEKPDVKAVWDQMRHDRSLRVQITADDVLRGLWQQYNRLLDMLAADWRDIYDENTGALLPVHQWPELWRTAMVNGIEVEEMFERSKDGGDSSWDKSGEVTKIKKESRLAIEKQIAETQKLLGLHVNVDAFVKNKPGDTNIMIVTAETARRVQSARKRLAKATEDRE